MSVHLPRITRRADFTYLSKAGKRWVTPAFAMSVGQNRPTKHPMPLATTTGYVGFTVTKQLSRKAVVRNRAKRRLREVARSLAPYQLAGQQIVLVARPDALTKPMADMRKDLAWALKRLDIAKKTVTTDP
jgi:ribonuclease P protein component